MRYFAALLSLNEVECAKISGLAADNGIHLSVFSFKFFRPILMSSMALFSRS